MKLWNGFSNRLKQILLIKRLLVKGALSIAILLLANLLLVSGHGAYRWHHARGAQYL